MGGPTEILAICSFCDRTENEVMQMAVAEDSDAIICDGCVMELAEKMGLIETDDEFRFPRIKWEKPD